MHGLTSDTRFTILTTPDNDSMTYAPMRLLIRGLKMYHKFLALR